MEQDLIIQGLLRNKKYLLHHPKFSLGRSILNLTIANKKVSIQCISGLSCQDCMFYDSRNDGLIKSCPLEPLCTSCKPSIIFQPAFTFDSNIFIFS